MRRGGRRTVGHSLAMGGTGSGANPACGRNAGLQPFSFAPPLTPPPLATGSWKPAKLAICRAFAVGVPCRLRQRNAELHAAASLPADKIVVRRMSCRWAASLPKAHKQQSQILPCESAFSKRISFPSKVPLKGKSTKLGGYARFWALPPPNRPRISTLTPAQLPVSSRQE